ncbi:MAG: class II aldolase/adducin family protein [Phycisphaerae bacterium]|nr:class II aldolase/adducin family protein [Phycisphaerae bacterium]
MNEKTMTMDNVLADLIRISQVTGSDPDLVQGGGGNTSVKTADGVYMYIKASGTSLKDMSAQKGWRRLRVDKVLAVVRDDSLEALDVAEREAQVVGRLLGACDDDRPGGVRPSIEAHLHALLGQTYVVHLHPRVISAYVNARDGRAVLEKLFADEHDPILWVDYEDPGFLCGRKMAQVVEHYHATHHRDPSIIFLEKHGLFTASDNADDILRLVRYVVDRCEGHLPTFEPSREISPCPGEIDQVTEAIAAALRGVTGQSYLICYSCPATIRALMERSDAPDLLDTGSLAPQEVTYANGPALWIEEATAAAIENKMRARMGKGYKHALAFVVKDVGLFTAGSERTVATAQATAEMSIFARMCAAAFGGVNSLTTEQEDFVIRFEAPADPGAVKG